MPKLRKVRTLPNGKKVSEIDVPDQSGRRMRGTNVDEESVLVDLTLMDESHERRRASRGQLYGSILRGLDRPKSNESIIVSQLFEDTHSTEASQTLSSLYNFTSFV